MSAHPPFKQIAVCGVENSIATQCNWILFGLDADGYVWQQRNNDDWWPVNREVGK